MNLVQYMATVEVKGATATNDALLSRYRKSLEEKAHHLEELRKKWGKRLGTKITDLELTPLDVHARGGGAPPPHAPLPSTYKGKTARSEPQGTEWHRKYAAKRFKKVQKHLAKTSGWISDHVTEENNTLLDGDLLHAVAPPGREDQVMKLKKKVGKKAAFKIAWSQYNDKKDVSAGGPGSGRRPTGKATYRLADRVAKKAGMTRQDLMQKLAKAGFVIRKLQSGGPGSGRHPYGNKSVTKPTQRGVKQVTHSPQGFRYTILKPSRRGNPSGVGRPKGSKNTRADALKGRYKEFIPPVRKGNTVSHIIDAEKTKAFNTNAEEGEGKTVVIHRDLQNKQMVVEEIHRGQYNWIERTDKKEFNNLGKGSAYVSRRYGYGLKLPK